MTGSTFVAATVSLKKEFAESLLIKLEPREHLVVVRFESEYFIDNSIMSLTTFGHLLLASSFVDFDFEIVIEQAEH